MGASQRIEVEDQSPDIPFFVELNHLVLSNADQPNQTARIVPLPKCLREPELYPPLGSFTGAGTNTNRRGQFYGAGSHLTLELGYLAGVTGLGVSRAGGSRHRRN